jgi:hypothetical protein
MSKVFDEAGTPIGELPDDLVFGDLLSKAEKANKLEEDLKTFTDKNLGVKTLREAVDRRDAKIAELQRQIEGVEKAEPTEDDRIKQIVSQETSKVLIGAEMNRALSSLGEEDRASVKKMFDKITTGESVNMETLPVFLAQAQRASFPDRDFSRARPITSGRPPRAEDGRKGFGDTDEGKEFASRMGLKLDNKKK